MSVQDCSVQPQKRSLLLSMSTYIRLNGLDRASIYQDTGGREYICCDTEVSKVYLYKYDLDHFRSMAGFSFYLTQATNVIMSSSHAFTTYLTLSPRKDRVRLSRASSGCEIGSSNR
jgi:hypothetical protein